MLWQRPVHNKRRVPFSFFERAHAVVAETVHNRHSLCVALAPAVAVNWTGTASISIDNAVSPNCCRPGLALSYKMGWSSSANATSKDATTALDLMSK